MSIENLTQTLTILSLKTYKLTQGYTSDLTLPFLFRINGLCIWCVLQHSRSSVLHFIEQFSDTSLLNFTSRLYFRYKEGTLPYKFTNVSVRNLFTIHKFTNLVVRHRRSESHFPYSPSSGCVTCDEARIKVYPFTTRGRVWSTCKTERFGKSYGYVFWELYRYENWSKIF